MSSAQLAPIQGLSCSIFYETFIKKVIDTSIIGGYYRGSF